LNPDRLIWSRNALRRAMRLRIAASDRAEHLDDPLPRAAAYAVGPFANVAYSPTSVSDSTPPTTRNRAGRNPWEIVRDRSIPRRLCVLQRRCRTETESSDLSIHFSGRMVVTGGGKAVLPPWQHRVQSSSLLNALSSNAAVSGFTSSLRWM
jgi:hypothetical protein